MPVVFKPFNLNSTSPAAPAGKQLLLFQNDTNNPTGVTAYDPDFVGDSGSGGKSGNVPAPAAGDAAANKYLKSNGSWTAPTLPATIAAASHQFLISYNAATGAFVQSQPAAGDISGLAASATTDTTNASNITAGTLGAARLPNPSATTLGGVESIAAVSHKFLTSISTAGVPAAAQPDAGDLTGLAASATTDTTNASNIGSGTLPAARLPNPSSTTLGGVKSIAAVSHQFVTSISTAGLPALAQPAAADISGLAASATTDATNASNITSGTLPAARLPNPSATTLGGVQSIAAVSHQFVTSISTSGVPALAQPAASDISGLGTAATQNTTAFEAAGAAAGLLSSNNAWGGSQTYNGNIQTWGSLNVGTQMTWTGATIYGTPANFTGDMKFPFSNGFWYASPNAATWYEFRNITSQGAVLAQDYFGSQYNSRSTGGGADSWHDVSQIAALTGAVSFYTTVTFVLAPVFTDAAGTRTALGLGTLATQSSVTAAQLPNPSSTTLGGVQSIAAVSHKFLTSISTSGVPAAAQPDASDLTGLAASATTDATNATNIGSGTLADGRLSSNVPLKNAANTFTAAQTVNATSGPGIQLTTTTADSLARVSNDGTASFKSTLQLYRSATDYGEITFWPGGSGLRINNARGDASTSIQFQQQGTTKVTIAGSTGALLVNTGTDNTVDKLQVSGHIATVTAGNGYKCKEGTNARMGTATLVAGTVTVSNTSITASTRVFVTSTGTANVGALSVSARVAGTSFTITSTNAADTSVVAWFLIEPA